MRIKAGTKITVRDREPEKMPIPMSSMKTPSIMGFLI